MVPGKEDSTEKSRKWEGLIRAVIFKLLTVIHNKENLYHIFINVLRLLDNPSSPPHTISTLLQATCATFTYNAL